MPNSKQCTRCGEAKPLDGFNRDKKGKLGRSAHCKACRSAHMAEYNARAEIKARAAEYRARPEVKEARADYMAGWRLDNLDARQEYMARWREDNHAAVLEYSREYYWANRDAVLEYQRVYAQENPHVHWEHGYRRRARWFGFEPVVEAFTKADVIDKYGDQCWHCGGPFEELDHHPTAVAHGGSHTLENTKPACGACNRKGSGVRTQVKEKA